MSISKLTHHQKTLVIVKIIVLFGFAGSASALPSFARQTGEACTACHVQTWGANLTPRGRDFKLKGYTEGGGNKNGWIPPVSAVIGGGGTFDMAEYKNNDYYIYPEKNGDNARVNGSLFYAGKIAGNFGAYVQGTGIYDSRGGDPHGFLDKVDLRYANQLDLPGHHIDYGISINNEPGVQDLWNTNATRSPFTIMNGTTSVYGLNTIAPLADRALSGQVAGATAYAMINNLLYVEAGGYASLPHDIQRGIGRADAYYENPTINGGAPYWRIALQHNWNGHYVSLGHFGLQANMSTPASTWYFDPSNLKTSYSDLGVDATYQYLANPDHIFELKGRYVNETRNGSWDNSFYPSGAITNKFKVNLDSFNVNGSYTWQQLLGLSIGYQQFNFQNPAADYEFNLKYLTTQLSYTPFGKQHSIAAPWLNLQVNLGYIADVSGHNYITPPPNSDMLYLNGQLAF